MKNKRFAVFVGTILILALSGIAFAQGKGNGRGNSGGKGKGNSGSVVDRIPDTGNGNSNQGKGKNKKNDPVGGIFDNDNKGKGSNRFKGLSKKTGVPQDILQARYEAERQLNPDLTYGQFVAAHMVSKNHRGVSTGDILDGLRNGHSIGQVLQDKGWDKDKIDKERKRIKKDREKDKDLDYNDDDKSWRLPF